PSGAHDDLFGQRAHGQREIDFNALLNVKLDVLADGAAEALKLRRDSVGSDLQARECVFPLAIGERIDRHTGRRLRRGDHRSRDARSSRLAIRAPRSGTYATNHCYGTLALRRKWPVSLSTGMVSTNEQDIDERREVHVDPVKTKRPPPSGRGR